MRAIIEEASSSHCQGAFYLRGKQSNNGGFCFFRHRYFDRPNLRDTYHATTALKLCGAEISRRKELLDFLNSERRDDVDGLYYFVQTMHALGIEVFDPPDIARIGGLVAPCGPSEELLGEMVEDFACAGGYGEPPNLREKCLSLKILALLKRRPKNLGETRRFVDDLQRADVGFADMQGTQNANLDVLCAGLECCALLGLPIRFASDALAYGLACQSADGSFSRVPVALPDVAYTHKALEAIVSIATGRGCQIPGSHVEPPTRI